MLSLITEIKTAPVDLLGKHNVAI